MKYCTMAVKQRSVYCDNRNIKRDTIQSMGGGVSKKNELRKINSFDRTAIQYLPNDALH